MNNNMIHDGSTLNWVLMIVELLGGVVFFLHGIDRMGRGLKKSAGEKIRSVLAKLTQNRFIGLSIGAFVTVVIQSSSATTVMLVSFVQSGLMRFVQTIGVILGADLGTTVTAQLLAFKITDWALYLIIIGFILRTFRKKDNIKSIGDMLFGGGLLFYGMKIMSDAMAPLQTYPGVIEILKSLENPFMGVLVGAILTALIHSSAALVGMAMVLAQQNLITLEAGIPLIMGANIGTCVTAGMACIGMSRDAKRVAIAHVFLKIAGVLIFIFWIPTFAEIVRVTSDHFNQDLPRKFANAHTLFNIGLVIFFLPLTNWMAKFIYFIYPWQEKEVEQFTNIDQVTASASNIITTSSATSGVTATSAITSSICTTVTNPPFNKLLPELDILKLDATLISNTPSLAIDLARLEISRMARLLNKMLQEIISPFIYKIQNVDGTTTMDANNLTILNEVVNKRESTIDYFEETISQYLFEISRTEISHKQSAEVYGLISVAKDLESIGDIIHKNLMNLLNKKTKIKSSFSNEGIEEITIYHTKVCKQIARLEEALAQLDSAKIEKIMQKMNLYLELESAYRVKHLERVRQNKRESIETHEIHMELMDILKQMNVYIGNIAKTLTIYQKHP
ncbi:MAG: Na/Pi cotransporter family protein [Oligoflexia bacterium]|nr:Na/Pi cotransporter family protein [Oligoflexia bacterium]